MAEFLGKVLSSSDMSTGLGWPYQFKVYIDLHCDDQAEDPQELTISADDLDSVNPWECFGRNERIKRIYLYKNKLFAWQRSQIFLHHSFIVFETHSYWWSIEKNSKGVTIQRSRSKAEVRDRYRRRPRTGFVQGQPLTPQMEDATQKKDLRDLMHFLQENKLVAIRYHLLRHNCQLFSRDIFNHLAAEKRWSS